MKTIEFTDQYKWAELTSDGLLKDPGKIGRCYDEDSYNSYIGFSSEEEALTHVDRLWRDHKYCKTNLVLVHEYEFSRKEKK